MAKTAILSGADLSRISRGDDPPYPPTLASGQRVGGLASGQRVGGLACGQRTARLSARANKR